MATYFKYLTQNPECAPLGCTFLASGRSRTLPGQNYPPNRHPNDHHFTWSKGRVLQAYQFVHIKSGQGRFEFGRGRQKRRVKAGEVLILFPGMWHRYSPDPDTGWEEEWIECKGSALEFFEHSRNLDRSNPVYDAYDGLETHMQNLHDLVQSNAVGNQLILSAMSVRIVTEFVQSRQEKKEKQRDILSRARMIITENATEEFKVEDLARELGVSSSYLRRIFKSQLGLSPKEFQISIRLQRASDLLLNSDRMMKEISGILGFSSAFHFSKQFKKTYGLPPSQWREERSLAFEQSKN